MLWLTGMIEIKRQTSRILQADVLRLRADKVQNSQRLDMSEEERAHLRAGCNFWRHPEPAQFSRDEGYLSQELEWMHVEDNDPGSAATGCGGLGIDDTTTTEVVELGQFVAPVHLYGYCSTASPDPESHKK